MGNKQIVGLDLIRFFAACLVMLFHLAFQGGQDRQLLMPFSWFGWVGVQIFFVLSGAVIANSAEHNTASGFLRGRILRLYPAVWICATVTLLIAGGSAAAYAGSLILWPFEPWVDGAYWTLGVEMAFYAVVWLLLARGGFDRLPLVLGGLAALSAVYWALRIAGVRYPAINALMAPAKDSRLVQILLIPDGALFALGGGLWLCCARRATPFRLAVVGLSLLAGATEIYATAFNRARELGQSPLAPVLVWAAAVGLIVVSFKIRPPASRTVRWIGLATYPLYLLHGAVGVAALKATGSLGLSLAAAIGAAAAVTVVLEPPVRRALAAGLDRIGLTPAAAA
jgi:peptidoglycan/LPS O-acetylase OafA/YrhL